MTTYSVLTVRTSDLRPLALQSCRDRVLTLHMHLRLCVCAANQSLVTMEFLACSTYYIPTLVGIHTGGAHGHHYYTVDESEAVISCVGIELSQALIHD